MRASARTYELQQPRTSDRDFAAVGEEEGEGETASSEAEGEWTGTACERVPGAGVGRVGTGVESEQRFGVGYEVGEGSATIQGGRSAGESGGAGGSSRRGDGGVGGSGKGVGVSVKGGAGGGSRLKAKLEPESPLAFIRPDKFLEFSWIPGMPDPVAFIEITNLRDSQLSFKIKCSFPEAYKVDPHWGFIDAGEIATVAVTLLPEWVGKISSHKFLVAVIHAPDVFDESNETLKEIWNSVPVDPTNYMEQKMTCDHVGYSDNDDNRRTPYGTKITQINKLLNNNQRLSSQLNALVTFQLLLALVIIMCGAVIIIVCYLGSAQVAKTGLGTTNLH